MCLESLDETLLLQSKLEFLVLSYATSSALCSSQVHRDCPVAFLARTQLLPKIILLKNQSSNKLLFSVYLPHNLQRLVPRQFNKHITSKMVIVVPARRPRQLSQEKSGNHQTWQDWHGNIIKALQPPLNDVEKLFRETESGREKIKKLEEGKATFTARPLCICNDAYKS